jgi:hypothetical protein
MDLLSTIEYLYIRAKGEELIKFTFLPSSISMFEIETTLNRYGVNVYARSIKGNTKSFNVKKGQAQYAEYLCFCANFPKIGILYPVNEKHRGKGLPKKQWEKKGRKKTPFLAFFNAVKKVMDLVS